LYWVDIEGHCFHRYFPDTGAHETYSIGQPIGCLRDFHFQRYWLEPG
jgi:sugar lactone lactonase YvrE